MTTPVDAEGSNQIACHRVDNLEALRIAYKVARLLSRVPFPLP